MLESGALYSVPISADYLLHDPRHRTALCLRISTTKIKMILLRASEPSGCLEPPTPRAPTTEGTLRTTTVEIEPVSKQINKINQIYLCTTNQTVSLVSNSKRKLVKKF